MGDIVWTILLHYTDDIMSAMASQITSLAIVYFNRLFRRRSKKRSKLRVTGFVWGIHRLVVVFGSAICQEELLFEVICPNSNSAPEIIRDWIEDGLYPILVLHKQWDPRIRKKVLEFIDFFSFFVLYWQNRKYMCSLVIVLKMCINSYRHTSELCNYSNINVSN